jgi:hypothetical protein
MNSNSSESPFNVGMPESPLPNRGVTAPGRTDGTSSAHDWTENKENRNPNSMDIQIDPELLNLPLPQGTLQTHPQSRKRPLNESYSGQNEVNSRRYTAQEQVRRPRLSANTRTPDFNVHRVSQPVQTTIERRPSKRRRLKQPGNNRNVQGIGSSVSMNGAFGSQLSVETSHTDFGGQFQPNYAQGHSSFTASASFSEVSTGTNANFAAPSPSLPTFSDGNVVLPAAPPVANTTNTQTTTLDTLWRQASLAGASIVQPRSAHVNLNWNQVDDVLKGIAARFGINIRRHGTNIALPASQRNNPTTKQIVWDIVFLRLILGFDHRKSAQILQAYADMNVDNSGDLAEKSPITTAVINGHWGRNSSRILKLLGVDNFDTQAFDAELGQTKGGRRKQYTLKRQADDVGEEEEDTETVAPSRKRPQVSLSRGNRNSGLNQSIVTPTMSMTPIATSVGFDAASGVPMVAPHRTATPSSYVTASQMPLASPVGSTMTPSGYLLAFNAVPSPTTMTYTRTSDRNTGPAVFNASSTTTAPNTMDLDEPAVARCLFEEEGGVGLLSLVAVKMSQRFHMRFTVEHIAALVLSGFTQDQLREDRDTGAEVLDAQAITSPAGEDA